MDFPPLTETYASVVTLPANVGKTPSLPPCSTFIPPSYEASIPPKSQVIQRLLSRRKKGHNAVANFIKREFHKHNLDTEEEIRKESKRMVESLEKIRSEMDVATAFLKSEDEELVGLNPTVFERLPMIVRNFDEERFRIIDGHYETMKMLERERSKRFKGVLNEAYRKMGRISHLLQYDLLQYFENEILKFNEITMSNYRHYAKIQADLKLQIQEDTRLFHLDLIAAKERHKRALIVSKVRGVVDLYKQAQDFTELQAVDELRQPSFPTDLPNPAGDSSNWSKQVQTTLDDMDTNARKLIHLYKTAVINVFNRFFEELEHITNALTEEDPMGSVLTMDCMGGDFYRSIVDDVARTYRCDVTDLQNLWDSITAYMESNIDNTQTFLNSTAHLWDGHAVRVRDFTRLIMQDLKLVIVKHDKAASDFDKKVNTTLDKLREDSTLPKLNEHLRDANKFLDSIGKLYSSQCEAEIKVLQKYHRFMDKATDLLLGEIDRFLHRSGQNEKIRERKNVVPEITDSLKEEVARVDPKERLIPYQMKACQYQVDAVNNWMFGLWDAIRHYMETCRSELTAQAENWVETNTIKLRKREEVRLATHKPRYLRIKTNIYDVRLKELEDHLDDLNKVEQRVKKYLTDSSSFTYLAEEKRVEIVEGYEKFLKTIEEKLQQATRSQHVAACIEQTKQAADEVVKKMEETFKDNQQVIDENRSKIDMIICNFSDSIKLFAEDGNYSRDEAKLFKKKILKIKKDVPKKHKKIVAEYSVIRKETSEKFSKSQAAILDRLKHSKAEFEHNETVCHKIKDLQSGIRRFAYDVKFKRHLLDACIDYYSEMSKLEIWKRKHFELMKDAIGECVEKIKELTHLLIEDEDSGGSRYVNDLNGLIDESLKEITEIAEGFYGSHGAVINKGKIHGSVDVFMEEVGRNLDGFRVQVEVHRLECVQELVGSVLRLMGVNDGVWEGLLGKVGGLGGDEESEESEELRRGLSDESLVVEERKKFLRGKKVVEEVVLGNGERVRFLHDTIKTLWKEVERKLALMEEVVLEEEEEGGE